MSEEEDEIWECQFCGLEFDDEDELNIHEADCDENPENEEEE